VDASSGVCSNVHHSNDCQHNKQGCQTNFKALKIEDRKIETFGTLAAPQNKNQSLQNFACSLLVTRVKFFMLLEFQFLIFMFFAPP
jgi:hypothetical protein